MPLIKYKFVHDKIYYSCYMTFDQYKNFQELPIVEECEILQKNQNDLKDHRNEMQKALELVMVNDTSHIRKLSDTVL